MLKKIMIIDDDKWLAELYQSYLHHQDVEVELASSAMEALDIIDSSFSLILLDINMPGANGIDFLNEIRSYDDILDIPVAIITSVPTGSFGLSSERWKSEYGVVALLDKARISQNDFIDLIQDNVIVR